VKVGRVDPDRVRVVHNFLDVEKWRMPSDDERVAARVKLGLSPTATVIAIPARISLQKHQAGVLLALDQMAARGELPAETVVVMP
jgi:starch synthase